MKKIKYTFVSKVPKNVVKVILTEESITALKEDKQGNTSLCIGIGKHKEVTPLSCMSGKREGN